MTRYYNILEVTCAHLAATLFIFPIYIKWQLWFSPRPSIGASSTALTTVEGGTTT